MILPPDPLPNALTLNRDMKLARSGPEPGALGPQLSALKRRRLLQAQQPEIQAGRIDLGAIAPDPIRPRPPA